jgi:hypothetical protein
MGRFEEDWNQVSESMIGLGSTCVGYTQCRNTLAGTGKEPEYDDFQWEDVRVPDEDKRRECREELRQMYESSDWMVVRFVAGRRLNINNKKLSEDLTGWCSNLKFRLSISGGEEGSEVPYVEERKRVLKDVRKLYQLTCSTHRGIVEEVFKYGLRNKVPEIREESQKRLGYTNFQAWRAGGWKWRI